MFKEKIKEGYTIKLTSEEQIKNLAEWLENNMDQVWVEDIEDIVDYAEQNCGVVYICPEEDDYNDSHFYERTELISYEEALLEFNEIPELKAGMVVDLKFEGTGKINPYILLEGDGELQPIDPTDGARGTDLKYFTVEKIYSNPEVIFCGLFKDRSTKNLDIIWERKEKSEKDLKVEKLQDIIKEAKEVIYKANKQLEELREDK